MLIIVSCLLITGGELVALGEAAEDQVHLPEILGEWRGASGWAKKNETPPGKPEDLLWKSQVLLKELVLLSILIHESTY